MTDDDAPTPQPTPTTTYTPTMAVWKTWIPNIFYPSSPPPTTPVNPQTTSPLAHLPLEVLSLILSRLTTQEISQFTQTCHLLQTYGEQMLYQNLKLPYHITQYQLNRLVRTLNARAEVGGYVRSVEFTDGATMEGPGEGYGYGYGYEYLGLGGEKLCIPAPFDRKRDLKGLPRLRKLDPAAGVVFLFAVIPNLRRLRVNVSVLEGEVFRALVRLDPCRCTSSCSLPLSFHGLEVLELESKLKSIRESWSSEMDETVASFIRLPSLREYTGALPASLHDSIMARSKGRGPFGLEKISCSTVNNEGLEDFLSRCPRLKTFEFAHFFGNSRQGFHCDTLYRALRDPGVVEKSLTRLVIYCGGGSYSQGTASSQYRYRTFNRRFGSLREFTRLESLEIPWMFLTHKNEVIKGGGRVGDILPAGLRELTINDYLGLLSWDNADRHGIRETQRDVARQKDVFAEYVMDWRSYTPELRGIEVTNDRDWLVPEDEHVDFLKETCEMGGIPLEFVPKRTPLYNRGGRIYKHICVIQ